MRAMDLRVSSKRSQTWNKRHKSVDLRLGFGSSNPKWTRPSNIWLQLDTTYSASETNKLYNIVYLLFYCQEKRPALNSLFTVHLADS